MPNSVAKAMILLAIGVVALTVRGKVARAETTVSGGPVGGQVWTAAGSPYLVRGDLTVEAGTTLRIEEGATVVVAVRIRRTSAGSADRSPSVNRAWPRLLGPSGPLAGSGAASLRRGRD